MGSPLRIVLVEDSDVYRSSLELVLGLREDLVVAAAVADGSVAGDVCARVRADVALVDLRLPGADGVAVAAELRRRCPQTAVVCLTAEAGPDEEAAALQAGAAAVVRKGRPTEELVAVIRQAASERETTWS